MGAVDAVVDGAVEAEGAVFRGVQAQGGEVAEVAVEDGVEGHEAGFELADAAGG